MHFLHLTFMSFSVPAMSVNSSSSTNDSLLHPNLSSVNSNPPPVKECFFSCPCNLIYFTYYIAFILLLLPFCVLVLYLGLQRWQQQSSTSTSAMSHSDRFTYHVVAMELIAVLGAVLCCCGIYWYDFQITKVGHYLYSLTWSGETYFNILTCLERYLAVIHPIMYLSLRGERGVRIRNISIGCVWLLTTVGLVPMSLGIVSFVVDFCLLILCLTVVVFCSLTVLYVLIRPGPGKQSEDRRRVDQSKQRAFYTIVAILVVVLSRCLWNLVWVSFQVLGRSSECVIMVTEMWFNLPCSLVLPLLFLHRAGRLPCCKNNTK